jgi:GNAT superfamily N-acetyltransferase
MHLDDLYVAESVRGAGVGRALIEFVHERSHEVGTGGVSWITAEDNADAQRLYDELARRTSWVTYEMDA